MQLTFARIAFIVLLASSASAEALPTLHASFDNGFDGVRSNGAVAIAKPAGFPRLVPGRIGNALLVGPRDYIEFPSADILLSSEGSIELWVRLTDWDPSDGSFHVFFDARGQGALHLYKYADDTRVLMLATDNSTEGPFYSNSSNVTWKKGEWHFLTGTWSAEGVQLFIDGVPMSAAPTEAVLPKSLAQFFKVGDLSWNSNRSSYSLIDELRVYDRALTPSEVRRHYLGDFSSGKSINPDGVYLTYTVDATNSCVMARLSTDADPGSRSAHVDFSIFSGTSRATVSSSASPLVRQSARGCVSLRDLNPGKYIIGAQVFVDGIPVATKTQELLIPDLAWQQESLEETAEVPTPWTPMKVIDGDVHLLGRRYAFRGSALPVQIDSAKVQLLERPISIRFRRGDEWLDLDAASQQIETTPTGDAVTITSVVRPQARFHSNIAFTVRARIEYDGLMWVSIAPDLRTSLADIQDLSISIPIKSDSATLRHRWNRSTAGLSGAVPSQEGSVDQSEFIPFYWLGNDRAGLFWFAETGQMWPNASGSNAIQVVRNESSVSLLLNIKARSQSFPKDWALEFGLQATPVKPLPSNWRKFRVEPAVRATTAIVWPTPTKDSFVHYGYPEATDPKEFALRLARLRTKGIEPYPYLCATFLSTASPEWPFFKDQWSMGVYDANARDVRAYGAAFAMVSPRGAGWEQFITWKVGNFFRRYGLRGAYFDNTHPYGAYAPNAGLGYRRDGKAQREYPILAYRDLYRRLRRELHKTAPDGLIVAHMSGAVAVPMLAYVDAYVDGEQLRNVIKDDYMAVTSLATFRAEFTGKQWGLIPIFLPQFAPEVANKSAPTRGLMALLMLHDASVWPLMSNVQEVNKALSALDSFGYQNATFHAYFDTDSPAKTALSDIYVSGYRKTGQDWLLIVGNVGKQRRTGPVCLTREFAEHPKEVRVVSDGSILKVSDEGCFEVNVAERDYLLISPKNPDGRGTLRSLQSY